MATKNAAADTVQAPAEAEYTVSEFAANSMALFGARKECVEAAMKSANIKSCPISKAKEIVAAFMSKEVK